MPKSLCFRLTPAQVVDLQAMQSTADPALQRRVTGLLLLHDGCPPILVATQLGVSLKSVYLWHERLRQDGPTGLQDGPRSGRPPRLTHEQKTQLKALLLDLQARAKEETAWQSRRQVTAYIAQTTGLTLPRRMLNQLLRDIHWSLPQERCHRK